MDWGGALRMIFLAQSAHRCFGCPPVAKAWTSWANDHRDDASLVHSVSALLSVPLADSPLRHPRNIRRAPLPRSALRPDPLQSYVGPPAGADGTHWDSVRNGCDGRLTTGPGKSGFHPCDGTRGAFGTSIAAMGGNRGGGAGVGHPRCQPSRPRARRTAP
jgi:hypothetical protein